MKCYACGYEKREKYVNVAEVKRFKSGKRKGEIKEVIEDRIDVFADDPEFIELFLANDTFHFQVRGTSSWWDNDYSGNYKNIKVYACPECGTLKINVNDV